jgi:elongation factor P
MFNVNDVKNGITFVLDGEIFTVLEFSHVKPGKGAAFVKMKVRNLRTGSNTEKSFNSGTKLEKAMIEKKPMQFLYASGDSYNFMNMETYEQIDLSSEQLGDETKFLKEGLNVDLSFYQGELLGVLLPDKVELEVVHTEPAVKGNTTNNATKDAELETGLVVKVPLFVEQGEKVIVSTATGKYDSRA